MEYGLWSMWYGFGGVSTGRRRRAALRTLSRCNIRQEDGLALTSVQLSKVLQKVACEATLDFSVSAGAEQECSRYYGRYLTVLRGPDCDSDSQGGSQARGSWVGGCQ